LAFGNSQSRSPGGDFDYLPNERAIRVSTYYADTPYSKNKPYIFTVSTSYEVAHQAW